MVGVDLVEGREANLDELVERDAAVRVAVGLAERDAGIAGRLLSDQG